MNSGSASSATSRTSASTTSTRTKPSASMNGSRSAATIGGRTALRTATAAATTNAEPGCSSVTPGNEDRGDVQRSRGQRCPGDQQTQRAQARLRRLPRHRLAMCPVCRHGLQSSARLLRGTHRAVSVRLRALHGYRRRHASVRGGRARRVGRLPEGAARAAARRDRPRERVVVRGGRRGRGRRRAARQAGRDGDVLHRARQRRPRAPRRERSCALTASRSRRWSAIVPSGGRVALLDARGERTIAVLGERLVPTGDDDLPWDRLAEMDGVYFTGGDAASLRAARAAGTLVATPRARDALTGSDVTLDALVRSAGDAGEQDDRERRGWSARLTVATRGPDGGTYTTAMAGPAPSRPPRSPARSWTPTEPATPSRPGSPSGSARAWTSRRPWRWRHAAARGTSPAPALTRDSRPRRNWACNGDGLPVGRADRDRARRSAGCGRRGRRRPPCVLGRGPRRSSTDTGSTRCAPRARAGADPVAEPGAGRQLRVRRASGTSSRSTSRTSTTRSTASCAGRAGRSPSASRTGS